MRTLGALGPRSFRRNAGRYVLTAVGIALGVGVVFGILLTNESITHTLDRQFGGGDPHLVSVSPAGALGGDVPSSLLDKAAKLPGVAWAYGSIGFSAPLDGGHDSVYVYSGISRRGAATPTTTRSGEQPKLHGHMPKTDSDEIVVGGGGLVDLLHARIGQPITLTTPTGPRSFPVSGIFEYKRKDTRAGLSATGAAVRRATGRGDVFDAFTIELGKGVDRTKWVSQYATALGREVRVAGGNVGLENLRNLYDTLKGGFAGLALVAMFVGAFLVFLTLSMVVIERTRLYGTLRALGAGRAQVVRVVVGEALLLGVVSTIAGLVLGLALGAGLLAFTARLYGIRQPAFVVPPQAWVEALAIGVLVTVGAALVPAVRASRLSPVEAIRGSFADDRRLSRSWVAGAGLLASGLALAQAHTRAVIEASSPVILLGAVLLTPLVTRPVARVAGRLTRRLAPGLGDIGVMHLVKERTRSAYTLALVMIVLALVLAIGGVHRSYRATQEQSLARALPADLAVSAGQRVDASYVQRVATTPGVRAVTELRFGDAQVLGRHGVHVFLTVIDPATFFAVQPVPWSEGSDAAARRALEAGDAVLVPEGLARLVGAGLGGRISMQTATGPHRFRVAGIYPSNDSQQRVTVGLADARRYFNAGDANVLAVRVRPGADVTTVGHAIEQRMASSGGAFVRPTSVDKARFRKSLDDYFRLAYAVLLVVLVMGLLGLGNTLAMSVVRRTREIGVLRAVGTHRSQVRQLMLVESATLTLVALVLAVPLGWLLSAVILRSSEGVLNVVIPYKQPWPWVPAVAVLAVVSAGVAAIAPARRASRVEPVTALRFE